MPANPFNPIVLTDELSTTRNLFKDPNKVNENSIIKESSNKGGLNLKGFSKKSRAENPLISIITVVLNGKEFIRETILSIIYQTYDNIEFIVIDGGSTDGTLEIIKKFEDAIDIWISEPDNGIYQAMNKGIRLASGDFINFLNADDHYTDSKIIERVISTFRKTDSELVYGDTFMFSKSKGFGWIRYSDVNPLYFLFKGIPQQVFFYKSDLFEKYGFFDESYRIVADLDYFLKLTRKYHVRTKYIQMPLVVFNAGATSSDTAKKDAERKPVIEKYFSRTTRFLFKNIFFFRQLANNDLTYPRITLVDKLIRIFNKNK